MRMQHHPLVPREQGRIPHQIPTYAERRTGCQSHPDHRPLARIVERIHHPDAILQDRPLILHQTVGRQPPCTFPDAHRPARRMKPQPHLARRRNRIVQPRPVRVQIQMIRRHRTARQRQFRQTHLRRHEHLFRPEPGPDRVQHLQPPEQQRILPARHRPCKCLIQMMMRVHQSRRHHAARRKDHLPRRRKALPDRHDHPIPDQDIPARNLPPRAVHCHNDRRAPDQNLRGHGVHSGQDIPRRAARISSAPPQQL